MADRIPEGYDPNIHELIYANGDAVGYTGSMRTEKPAATKITKLAFKQRMTKNERIAVREAAKTNAEVFDFQDLLDSATYVDLDRQDTIDGVNQLEASGLLADGRASEILTAPVEEHEKYKE